MIRHNLRQQGIRVLRFSNQQVFTSMQGVLAEILRAANGDTDPTPAPSPTWEGSATESLDFQPHSTKDSFLGVCSMNCIYHPLNSPPM
ncbi:DUF559 domain-containing protein [Xylanibacter brevis]|uniref:DUF559 domain-containing protein n=1 Tax=Xylanibacter brevis TaxID=83231 RepID=UPI0012DD58EF